MTFFRSRSPRRSHPRALPAEAFRLRPTAGAGVLHCALLGVGMAVAAMPALAQPAGAAALPAGEVRKTFDVPQGPLDTALDRFARTAGVNLSYDAALIAGLRTAGLSGTHSVAAGLATLLAGSGLQAVAQPGGGYSLRKAAAPTAAAGAPAAAQAEAALPTVRVTASSELMPGDLPKPFAGGQVARGARVGALGNADMLDTPFAITSFTDEFKQNLQARTLTDILKYSVSVQTPQAISNPQNDIINMRGLRNSTAMATFDGLPGLFSRLPPIEAFERTEVLLGPSAFANGRASNLNIGGSVNLVPKRGTDEPLTRLGLRYESDSIFGTSLDVGRRFGVDNVFGVRVNTVYSDGNASMEGSPRTVRLGSLALDYRGEQVRASVDVIHRKLSHRTIDFLGLAPGLPVPKAPDAGKSFIARGAHSWHEMNVAVARAEWDFAKNWTATAAYGFSHVPRDRQLAISSTIADAAGRITGTAGEYTYEDKRHSTELSVRGRVDTGGVSHRVSLGLTRFTMSERASFPARVPVGEGNLYVSSNAHFPSTYPVAVVPSRDLNTAVTNGAFISDEMGFLNDRLRVTLGLRRVALESNSFNATTGAQNPNGYDSSVVSPALGILYKVSPKTSVYANHVEALEPGIVVPPPLQNAGQVMQPLKSKQTEAGVKFELDSAAVTFALFEGQRGNQYADMQRLIFVQDGRQRVRGFELSYFGEPVRGLRLYGGLTGIDAVVKNSPGGTLNGKTAISVPDYTLTASLDWDVPGVPGLALTGGLIRTGPVWLDAMNTQRVPAWTRLDAGVRYASKLAGKNVVWRFNVENLADKNYFMGDLTSLYIAPPRSFLASATIDF
jgi:iron complex outermembrane recepter protein